MAQTNTSPEASPGQASGPAPCPNDAKQSFWKRSHYLDRMTLGQLVSAYFQHYTIIAYISSAVAGAVICALYPPSPLRIAGSILAVMVVFPLVWHLLHQFVLHGQWMYKIKPLASTWKRIHYDHHQDPNHLEVLFGALHTTMPTIFVVSFPVGYLIGGLGGGAIAFSAGILTICYYEFMHCIEHLAFKPRWKWVQYMKQRHAEHHYADEDGNYGITNFLWDHILGTYYEKKDRPGRSPTVFNLGYTEEVALKYPWVKEYSGGIIATGHPVRRALGKEGQSTPN